MKIAVSPAVINKAQTKEQFELLATTYKNLDLTQLQLAEAINKGYSFTTHHQGRRDQDNFILGEHIGLDFDRGSQEEMQSVKDNPLVRDYCGIFYHTASSRPEAPRFRIVFQLEHPIHDAQDYRRAVLAFIWYFGANVDKTCKDPCRIFYGSKDSNPEYTDRVLPAAILADIVKKHRVFLEQEQRAKDQADRERRKAAQPAGTANKGVKTFIEKVLDSHCERIRAASKGACHDTLLTSATVMGGYLSGHPDATDEYEIRRRLEEAYSSHSWYNKSEMLSTIEYGLEKGRAKPLYVDPLPIDINFNGFTGAKAQPKSDPWNEKKEEKAASDQPDEESILDKLFWHADQLKDLPLPDWLDKPLLIRNSIAFIVGDTGTYKSFFAVDRALEIAQTEPIAYIAGEGHYATRVEAWKKYHNKGLGQAYFSKRSLQPANLEQLPFILRAMRELKPVLIVIDTLNRAAIGLNENDQRDMGLFIEACTQLREATGATVLVIHHTNRGGSERGSSAIKDGADTFIKFTKEDNLVKVECEKQKDRKNFDTFYFETEVVALPELVYSDGEEADSLVVKLTASPAETTRGGSVSGNMKIVLERLALEVFKDTGATGKRLLESLSWETSGKRAEMYRILSKLIENGYVTQDKKGEPYKITAAGLDLFRKSDLWDMPTK